MKIDFVERRSAVLQGVRVVIESRLCSGNYTVELDPNDLEGTWVASVWELTNPANASQSVDMLAAGGSMTIVFRSDGTFTSTILDPNETVPDVDTGTYEVVGSALTIAESGQGSPTLFQAVRDGNTLTLTSSDEDYDWDDDGTDDPANMRIVLNRQ